MLTHCKSCGAEIRWVKMHSGKAMPVDADPVMYDPDGGKDVLITKSGFTERGTIRKDGKRRGYISHFATCPNADRHRKARA